jgi:broad specificity polyphosphatase/5'/3'-nucleotidase SurE
MNILVTNDDGINARGIFALADVMKPLGKVNVIAPLPGTPEPWTGP